MSLFGISEEGEEVSFVEVREGENVYSSHHGPFLYITQFNLALNIITMSTDTFLKVSIQILAGKSAAIFLHQIVAELNRQLWNFAKI